VQTPATALDKKCLEACLVGRALDGMCVGMILTNAAGRIAWLNRSAERILGLDRALAQGELLQHLLRDPSLAEFWHRANATADVLMGEVALHWPKQCDLKVNASNCKDTDGQSIGRALLFCDITTERAAQIQLSREATERLLEVAAALRPDAVDSPHAGLTPQELRTLRLVGRGFGNEEIARELRVATSTVRTHLKHVYAKLGLPSRSEAISYAIRHGLAER
jgi:DNA-binding CsgD family transcriptional regulator